MKKTVYVLGYLLACSIVIGLLRRFILDDFWVWSTMQALIIGYGIHLYNKKFAKKPINS